MCETVLYVFTRSRSSPSPSHFSPKCFPLPPPLPGLSAGSAASRMLLLISASASVSRGRPRCSHSSRSINWCSIRHRRYSFASSLQFGAFSFFTSFMHSRYRCICKMHSLSWSSGNEPRSGGVGDSARSAPPGFPDMGRD